jgi:hypothetical protein
MIKCKIYNILIQESLKNWPKKSRKIPKNFMFQRPIPVKFKTIIAIRTYKKQKKPGLIPAKRDVDYSKFRSAYLNPQNQRNTCLIFDSDRMTKSKQRRRSRTTVRTMSKAAGICVVWRARLFVRDTSQGISYGLETSEILVSF